jgi:hypothetical protein
MAALEVKKGDFLYRDTLFVDLGENKRHPRASVSELKDLLLPKKGNAPPKDQVAHWYEAQLLHYGLPHSKDKNTAKVRLTNAISSGALAIPSSITNMEADMKKEYNVAVRKAKAAEKKPSTSQTDTKGKKRKAEDTTTTTISVKVGDVTLEIGQQTSKKKTKVETTKAASTKVPPKPKAPAIKRLSSEPKATKSGPAPTPPKAKQTRVPKPATLNPPSSPPSSAPTPRPIQTARRGRPFPYPATGRPTPAPAPMHEVHDHTPAAFYDNDTDMDDAPPAYESQDFSHEDDHDHDDAHWQKPTARKARVQISGRYELEVAEHGFQGEMGLRIDQDQQQLCGYFDIGPRQGVIRAESIVGITNGDTITVGWRSEDDQGNLRFGRGCDGSWNSMAVAMFVAGSMVCCREKTCTFMVN